MRFTRSIALVVGLACAGWAQAREVLRTTPVGVGADAVDLGERAGLGVLSAARVEGVFVRQQGGLGRPAEVAFTGRRLVLEGLTIDQLVFANPEQALDYGSRIERGGHLVVDVRGPFVVLLDGPAASDPERAVAALRAAWRGGPGREPRSLLAIISADGTMAALGAHRGPVHEQVANAFRVGEQVMGQLAPGELRRLDATSTAEWLDAEHEQLQLVDATSVTRGVLTGSESRFATARDRPTVEAALAALEQVARGARARLERVEQPAPEPPASAAATGEPAPPPASKGVRRILEGLFGE